MIEKAGQVNVVPMLGHRVFYLAETLLLRKWSDTEITEDLEWIKEELGNRMVDLRLALF
jgi:V-type H+-transporting ATPase subunit H